MIVAYVEGSGDGLVILYFDVLKVPTQIHWAEEIHIEPITDLQRV